jgi:large subunit ribosomal protein L21e
MVKKSRGPRRDTRRKLKQTVGKRPAITKFLRTFKSGEKVVLYPEPSSQKGMPFLRYKGRVGTIAGKRGNSYIVEFKDGGKKKTIISRPEHLKPSSGA